MVMKNGTMEMMKNGNSQKMKTGTTKSTITSMTHMEREITSMISIAMKKILKTMKKTGIMIMIMISITKSTQMGMIDQIYEDLH